MSTLKSLRQDIAAAFGDEYRETKYPALRKISTFLTGAGADIAKATLVGAVASLAISFLLPVAAPLALVLGSASLYGSLGGMTILTSGIAGEYAARFLAERQLDKDTTNGTLVKRYQQEILPQAFAQLKEQAKSEVAARKQMAHDLTVISKLTAEQVAEAFARTASRPDQKALRQDLLKAEILIRQIRSL